MKKLLPLIPLAAILLILALPPAGPNSGETGNQVVVGFVELLSESPWRDRVSNSIAEAAANNGMQLITVESERTQDSQIQAIRKLITYQVDAIVFSPVVMFGWDNVLGETQAANIPVILTERTVKAELNEAIAAYVGSDYEAQGRAAAEHLVSAFEGRAGPIMVMELTGTVGSSSNADRGRGIREVLNPDARFDIDYSVSCDQMYSKAKETMGIYLNNSRHPDALISYGDAMTLGAIEAMESHGIKPGRDILIISFDAQQDAVDLLAQGKINCLIETNPNVGERIMETARRLYEGSAGGVIYPDEAVFTRDSGEIPPRGY